MNRTEWEKTDLVICESVDGWSIHAPGAQDEEIASGDAPPLATGPWVHRARLVSGGPETMAVGDRVIGIDDGELYRVVEVSAHPAGLGRLALVALDDRDDLPEDAEVECRAAIAEEREIPDSAIASLREVYR